MPTLSKRSRNSNLKSQELQHREAMPSDERTRGLGEKCCLLPRETAVRGKQNGLAFMPDPTSYMNGSSVTPALSFTVMKSFL